MVGNRITAILLLLVLSGPLQAQAAMEPLPKIRAGTPPYSVLGNIMGANSQQLRGTEATAPGISRADSPHLVWLADPDARLSEDLVWDGQVGGIYTVRNLGNQVEPAAGAIDYAIRHLYTPVLLITGNTDSEALQLFAEGYNQLGEAIRRELNHLHPALSHLAASGKEPRSAEAVAALRLRAVEANLDYQVTRALERYGDRVKSGRLVVAGAIIDLANQYQGGPGRLYLVNVNGETSPEKIKSSPHLIRLGKEMRNFVGRR